MDVNPDTPTDFDTHPLVKNVNDIRDDEKSYLEKVCSWVCDEVGSPVALILIIVIQFIWIIIGQYSKLDPYPYSFLLTISNVLQLILIFILAVGQRESQKHAEMRAQNDHDNIVHVMHHQDLQEIMLFRLMEANKLDTSDVKQDLESLSNS
jgi:uncharacterized membrane protein